MSPELRSRLLVALIGVPFGLYAMYLGGIFFTVLVALLSSLIIREMARLLRKLDMHAISLIIYFSNLAIIAVAHFGTLAMLSYVVWSTILVSGFSALRPDPLRGARRLLATLYVPMATGFPLASLIMLRDSESWSSNLAGGLMIMLIVGGVWIVDTAAYMVGKNLGRHKLAPNLSPKKTVEGAVGSVLSGVVFSILWGAMIAEHLPLIHRVFIGAIIGSVSILGDLVQSMIKRAAGVKDSGRMFFGHGGVYDRFDSLMYVAPSVFLYLLATGLIDVR